MFLVLVTDDASDQYPVVAHKALTDLSSHLQLARFTNIETFHLPAQNSHLLYKHCKLKRCGFSPKYLK